MLFIVFVVLSWFISPILAGIVSVSLFFICRYFILNKVSLFTRFCTVRLLVSDVLVV